MSGYAIDGGWAGKRRLDLLAAVMEPHTAWLLDAVGVATGSRCLDVGCGGGHVTRELARRVGPEGRVIGIDVDQDVISLARVDAQREGLTNVFFEVQDAAALEAGDFDLAYSRFLLSHVQSPASVLASIAAAVRPGGAVVLEDTDFRASFCYPESAAYQRFVQLYRATVSRFGGNADIGPALPALLRSAGVKSIALDVRQPSALTGPTKLMTVVTLERISRAAIGERLATPDELDAVLAALRDYYEDPTTLMSVPRIIRAWGRTPRTGPK
jgi:SAM-dependent methyltransferase